MSLPIRFFFPSPPIKQLFEIWLVKKISYRKLEFKRLILICRLVNLPKTFGKDSKQNLKEKQLTVPFNHLSIKQPVIVYNCSRPSD